MAAPAGPISSRVGLLDRWQNAQIAYVAGQMGPPMPLLKRGVLSYIDLHVNGTLAGNQAAGAAAMTFNGFGPWGLIGQAQIDVGANTKFNASVGGYDLMVRELYRHPAYTATYSAPLPGANGGTQAVPYSEPWSWRQRLPITVDENDLTGLILLARQDAETTVLLNWRDVTSILNVPAGSTAAFTGQANIEAYGYGTGKLQPADLALAHVLLQVPVTIPAQSEVMVPLLLNRQLQALYMIPYVGGVPDTTGQIQVAKVTLQHGDRRPEVFSAGALQFGDQLHARGNVPPGVLVLDRMRNRPTQYLDLFNVNQAFITLDFSAAPPAGSTFNFLYEYLR